MSRHDRHFANCICVDCENERPAPPVDRARLAQIAQEMRAAPVRPFSEGGHGGARVSLLVDAHAVHRWASAIEAAIGAKP